MSRSPLTVRAFAEPRLVWDQLHRFRTESGLAFEKHRWTFPSAGPAWPGGGLFELAGEVVVRELRAAIDEVREVPVALLVNRARVPALSRVAFDGEGAAALLAALLVEENILWAPGAGERAAVLGASPDAAWPSLARIPATAAAFAMEVLSSEPGAYLFAGIQPGSEATIAGWPLARSQLKRLNALSKGSAPFVDFAALALGARWLATGVGVGGAVALYGSETLLAQVREAATRSGVELAWLGEPGGGHATPLPGAAEVPQDSVDVLDLAGTNARGLPAVIRAREVRLDASAVADLAPLAAASVERVTLRHLRPRSLLSVAHVPELALGPVDVASLTELAESPALRRLELTDTPLVDLRPLSEAHELRSLSLRGVPLERLDGLEALTALEELSLDVAHLPAGLEQLAGLPQLRSLTLHSLDALDCEQLPVLPALERLDLSGLDGRAASLVRPERLAAFIGLRALALRTTDVVQLEWISALSSLQALDLAATAVAALAPLRALGALRRLDLSQSPAVDLSVIAALSELEELDVSFSTAFAPSLASPRLTRLAWRGGGPRDLRDLSRLTRLRSLDLGQCIALASFEGIAALVELEELDVRSTAIADLAALGGLGALRHLSLDGCPIADVAPLGSLGSLRALSLAGTAVRDVAALVGCRGLASLDLSTLALDDLAPLRAMPELSSLQLRQTTAGSTAVLGELTSLRSLDVSGVALTSFDFAPRLRRLREVRAGSLPGRPDASPLLDAVPLARLELDATYLRSELGPRLRARHHVFPVGE